MGLFFFYLCIWRNSW